MPEGMAQPPPIVLIKLDTLPYRSGHETWLDDALERVDKYRLFGMTGGFPIADLVPLEDGYSTTQKIHRQLFNFTAIRLAECHPCHHRQWL